VQFSLQRVGYLKAGKRVVAAYLRAVDEGEYQTARGFIIPEAAGGQVQESFLKLFGGCDFSLVHVRCMDVGKVSQREAVIYVARCLVSCDRETDDWIFRLKRDTSTRPWRISEIRAGKRLWFQVW